MRLDKFSLMITKLTRKQLRSRMAEINRIFRNMENCQKEMQPPIQESLKKMIYCMDKMTSLWAQPVQMDELMRLREKFMGAAPETVPAPEYFPELEALRAKKPRHRT